MSSNDSSGRVVRGGIWMIAARMFDRCISVLSVAILARLLRPDDFGMMAIAGTVVAAVELMSSFGFDWALVRHPQPLEAHYNSAWTLRVLLGIATFAVLLAIGPLAAAFYGQPSLTPLLVLMGITTIVGSLENIGTVDFRRNFDFAKEFKMRATARILSFLVTVAAAYYMKSYWALAIGIFSSKSSSTIYSYIVLKYRPKVSLEKARELFSFSAWLLVGNIIEFARDKVSDVYIGKVIGPRGNGLYSMVGELAHLSISEVAAPINRAAFSKYSEDVRAERSISKSYASIASMIWLIALPVAGGTCVVASEAVRLLLGPGWGEGVSILQLVSIGAVFTAMTSNTHYVYWALGLSKLVARLSLLGVCVILPLTIILGSKYGLAGVAFAYLVGSGIMVPINFYLLSKYAKADVAGLLKRIWRITIATILMMASVYILFPRDFPTEWQVAVMRLIAKSSSGAGIFIATLWSLWVISGRPAGPEQHAWEIVYSRLKKTNS